MTAFLVAFVFLPGIARAGFIDDLGSTFGLDEGFLGAILGMVVVILVIALLAIIKAPGGVIMMAIIMVAGVNLMLGFWPSWSLIILAVVGGALVWREIINGGGAGKE